MAELEKVAWNVSKIIGPLQIIGPLHKGLVSIGSISLGAAFVAGRKRVPYPAAGKRHLLINYFYLFIIW
jgi:hypothetical protein